MWSTERVATHLLWKNGYIKPSSLCIDANTLRGFVSYSKQLMHICIVWFAKVEKIILLGQMGDEVVFCWWSV